MANGGSAGVGELDPMEDLKRSVDEAVGPDGAPIAIPDGYTSGNPEADGSYLDSERNDPPPSPGDTD
jgi:hypothetical protein